ncbi:polysaccharide deacetylase family protein, partial [Streptomyces hainanensis]
AVDAEGSASRLRPFTGAAAPAPAAPRRVADVPRTLAGVGRRIALTFDDGPDPTYTPKILRVLREHHAPATFFVCGENAEWQPDLLRAIRDEGHLLANHTWSHPQLDLLSRAEVRDELGRTSDVVARAVGRAPRLARAPYGVWDEPSLRVCAELGMRPLGWSVDSDDWTRPGADRIAATLLDGAHPGAVALAHDGGGDREQTVAALRACLPRLLDRGFEPVLPG